MVDTACTFSLAALEANERVVIHRIMFGKLADFCSELGLNEGAEVLCCAASTRRLYLTVEGKQTVAIDRDRARFIQVRPPVSSEIEYAHRAWPVPRRPLSSIERSIAS